MKIREKYPRFIRWTHWINHVALTMMVWSGLMIYWANPAYLPFPDSVADNLNLSYNLALGLSWHFLMMWIFTINGVVYLSLMFLTGKWREIVPQKGAIQEALQVTLHDLRIRKTLPPRRTGLNAAQRIAYTSILLTGALAVFTGIAIYKPVSLGGLTEVFGGYEQARAFHFLTMIIFVLFFVVHVLQVLRSGWNTLRAMIAGYEIDE